MNKIHDKVKSNIMKTEITSKIIQTIFKLIFSFIPYTFDNDIEFICSNKLSSTAARLDVYDDGGVVNYKLVISKKILTNLDIKTSILCHGVKCYDIIDCLICLIEHEIIHYLIDKKYPDERHVNHHSNKFKKLAYKLFHHTNHEHELLTIPQQNIKLKHKYKIKIDNELTNVTVLKKYSTYILVRDEQHNYYHAKPHVFVKQKN